MTTLLELFERYDADATSVYTSDNAKAFAEFRAPLVAAIKATMADAQRTTEEAYEQGSRMAWRIVLRQALQHLGADDSAASAAARWVVEREEAIASLRAVCAAHGDTEWPDNLHLSDIIEKHLARHLG